MKNIADVKRYCEELTSWEGERLLDVVEMLEIALEHIEEMENGYAHLLTALTGHISDLPPRHKFTDNGDGTVTDNTTGLLWMQWTFQARQSWKDALDWCENLELAGYDDWRLPTRENLLSIVDYDKYDPAIDTDFFPDTKSAYYWSSSTNAYNPDYAWLVYFYYGHGGNLDKSNAYYVRAVRGGE